MDASIILISFLVYMALLFLIAHYAERKAQRGRSLVDNPIIYSLSLAVYCTAWTFFGSVGRAATQGFGFLPIYIGPAVLAPVWLILLRKIILISKNQRTTSIADFISARYGKSATLGTLATIVAVFGIIPYISIQLKAIDAGLELLTAGEKAGKEASSPLFFLDTALYIAIALALFSIFFGTRRLDPNERHEGLIAAIAFESIFKLVAFLAVGIFVTFGLFDGFGDLFEKALANPETARLFSLPDEGISSSSWFWLVALSMSAILFLPRQFHVAVVESTRPEYVKKASWLFSLYLLLINIFVIPIALGGMIYFSGSNTEPDTFVLSLPLSQGRNLLALFVMLGGFSAATGMVIVSVIALSIMAGNNLLLPVLLKTNAIREGSTSDLNQRLLGIRRISIVVILLLAYGYLKTLGREYSLVSIGLVSFTAIVQFAPVVLGGIFWKRATRAGAFWGLLAGFIIWGYTLPLATLSENHLISEAFFHEGIWGLKWLRPYALFGLDHLDQISHAAFWSLFFNTFIYILVSLNTQQSPIEVTQADIFVDIYKYQSGGIDFEVMRRRASIFDIQALLHRFLGEARSKAILRKYEKTQGIDLSREKNARPDLVSFAETHLAGAIGAASAKVIIATVAKEDPISLEEMFKILEQTQEIMQYSKALEKKSEELEGMTLQLKAANERLKELDRLKADFITTATHELRTPITSIRSLSKIILDNKNLPEEQKDHFLNIIVAESERITRLINQVLDLEKIQDPSGPKKWDPVNFTALVRDAYAHLSQLMEDHGIKHALHLEDPPIYVLGDKDRLIQVVVNLLSNASKFCDPDKGQVAVTLLTRNSTAVLLITDNGKGIPPEEQEIIFEKFTQLHDRELGKPKGSGLGLFITKTIVEHHNGHIKVHSNPGQGTTFSVTIPLADQPSGPGKSTHFFSGEN